MEEADTGRYSKLFANFTAAHLRGQREAGVRQVDHVSALQHALKATNAAGAIGSTTASLASLVPNTGGSIVGLNLGDSGLLLLRWVGGFVCCCNVCCMCVLNDPGRNTHTPIYIHTRRRKGKPKKGEEEAVKQQEREEEGEGGGWGGVRDELDDFEPELGAAAVGEREEEGGENEEEAIGRHGAPFEVG